MGHTDPAFRAAEEILRFGRICLVFASNVLVLRVIGSIFIAVTIKNRPLTCNVQLYRLI